MADETQAPLSGQAPICVEALKRFQICTSAEDVQRRAIVEAKNFRAGNQWPDQIKLQRQGVQAIAGVSGAPARPCLTIDRISAPLRHKSNTVKQANFSMEALPDGDGASKKTAQVLNGWMRRVQNAARADDPVVWAADQSNEGGIGWFRLRADYCSTDPDDEFFDDQDLFMEKIVNNLSVYCDPSAVKPMRQDAKFLLKTADFPRDEFKRAWPNASVQALDAFQGIGDNGGWVTDDVVRVAEYWRIEYHNETRTRLMDGTIIIGEVPKGAQVKHQRVVPVPVVKWSKITACEELESGVWLGTRIPFIPVTGEEINVDGKRVLMGDIGPSMDAQRMVNYTYSGAIETLALQPKSPFVAALGQIEAHKQIWGSANTVSYSVLPYDPVELNGHVLPPPQRQAPDAPIQGLVEMMRVSEEAISAMTSFDPSLAMAQSRSRSGEQVKALQSQGEFGQSGVLSQVQRSLIYCADLMVELAPKILDRPGRIIQILGIDDEPQQVMLGQHFVQGKEGMPQAAQETDEGAILHNLSAGHYKVTVNVGKASTTRRQEGTAAVGELIPHLPPEMAAAIVPSFIRGLDFPGADKIADIAERALPPNLQPNPEMDNLPPAAAAQIQQLQGVIQQLQAELQKLQPAALKAQTDAAKIQSDQQKVVAQGQIDLQLQDIKSQTAVAVASIQAAADKNIADMKVQVETLQAMIGAEKEARLEAARHAHDAGSQMHAQAHEVGMAAVAHAHNLDASQQAAALTPPPVTE